MTSLGGFAQAQARRFENRPLFLFGDEVVTYRGYDKRTDRVAGGLARLGLGRGDRMAVLLPSFLGVGIPPQTPTWGNIMAEGRTLFRVFPHNILFPAVFLVLTILAVNTLGDGLRDMLDPRMRKRL